MIRIFNFIALIFCFPSLFSQQEIISLSEDLELLRLSDNAFIHVSYKEYPRYGRVPNNGLIFIDSSRAVMVDTPVDDSLTSLLIAWFRESMNVTMEAVIPSHWHDDCLGGLHAAHDAGAQSYSLTLTKILAAQHNYTEPHITFNDSLTLKIGESKVICKYFGGGHSLDNIVVWIPSEKILFGGCMVKPVDARGLGNTSDADLEAWPHTVKILIEQFPDARIVIPGHGNFGGVELLEHTYSLFAERSEGSTL